VAGDEFVDLRHELFGNDYGRRQLMKVVERYALKLKEDL